MATVRFEEAQRWYPGTDRPAVPGISLDIKDGEFMVLVGPSGCGKTTLLRTIAGLEDATAGRIWIGDDDVTVKTPQQRDIAMVFQNYALYPHMTVAQNLAYGLKLRRMPRAERDNKVRDIAAKLALDELLDRKPAHLSGGQRQRVAMGRAIVREPKAFLMDEPLSNLDAKLRVSMRAELARLHEHLGVTTVYVTHDQVEAMTLGQRVAVMRDGVVQQCDVPQRLFEQPANLFVGAFIGSPAMNLVEARLEGAEVRFGSSALRLPGLERLGQRAVALGIRPTSFTLAGDADPGWPRLTAQVDVVEQLGAESNLLFTVDAPPVATEAVKAAIGGESGADEGRLLVEDRRARFTARIFERVRLAGGDRVELAIDPSQLHLFDLDSGEALAGERPLVETP